MSVTSTMRNYFPVIKATGQFDILCQVVGKKKTSGEEFLPHEMCQMDDMSACWTNDLSSSAGILRSP